MSRLKGLWVAVVIVIVASVTSLAACEVALRLCPPPWLRYRMEFLALDQDKAAFNSNTGWPARVRNGVFWGYEPNSEFVVSSYAFVNTAHIDELGGRKVGHVEEADRSRPVLPFLGDSFTFGVGVSDDETFATVLSGELQELRILDLGVPGTALDRQRKTITLRHTELGSPKKYIFFFFMGNDFSDLMMSARHMERNTGAENRDGGRDLNFLSHWSRLALYNATLRQPYLILRQSYLFQLARMPLLQFVDRLRRRSDARPYVDTIFHIMNVADHEYQSRARAVLDSELDNLAHMQQEYGFSSLIVAIPDRHQINEKLLKMDAAEYGYDDAIFDPSRPNSLLKDSAAGAGIPFFDPTSCLRAAADPFTLYYRIDDHFTAVGHRTFARCIAPELKRFIRDGDADASLP